MKTYQGETEKSLRGQLDYALFALTHDLEKWEKKEYEKLKKDLEEKLTHFDN